MNRITIDLGADKTGYLFDPKEDITAYELAQCLSMLLVLRYRLDSWEDDLKKLTLDAQRHFKPIPLDI